MEMTLCERFTTFTPLSLRREKAREVFSLVSKYNKYMAREKKRNKKHGGKHIVRRPSGDNWF
jgi:hypothetical protein